MQSSLTPRRWLFGIALVVLASVLVLFPFDWLATVWPAMGSIFDRVFVGPREHAIGHATIFTLAGSMMLVTVPMLRQRPLLYLALMASGAIAEESVQSIFRGMSPSLSDSHALFFDAVGTLLALAGSLLWRNRMTKPLARAEH